MTGDRHRTAHRPKRNTGAGRAFASDLINDDLSPACPSCGDLNHPTLARCETCGAYLYPRTTTRRPRSPWKVGADGEKGTIMPPSVPGCTCGGLGACTRCVIASYEAVGDQFAIKMLLPALEATERAMGRDPALLGSAPAPDDFDPGEGEMNRYFNGGH